MPAARPTILKTRLKEWTDWDGARMDLAICLGLMTHETNYQTDAKHVFWSNNPVGNMLYNTLQELVKIGVLEFRDEPDQQFCWNPGYKGTWE